MISSGVYTALFRILLYKNDFYNNVFFIFIVPVAFARENCSLCYSDSSVII